MNNMKINIPEGFEIDKENSSLETGEIVFKKVENKYPTEFKDLGTNTFKIYTKYSNKLSILNTLLHFRDEYNKIDGFTEDFRFRDDNWCISNYENKLYSSCWTLPNGIMHFGKKETTKLFLKNFEEQLEQIKEFL